MSSTLVLLFAIIVCYIWNVFLTMRLDSNECSIDMLEDEMLEEINLLKDSIKAMEMKNRMLGEKLYGYIDSNNVRVTDIEDLATSTDDCLTRQLSLMKSMTNVTSASVPTTNT